MKRNGCLRCWKKACAAGLLIASGATLRADENDQYWLTGTVKYKMTDHVSFKIAEQTRYKDEDHYYRHTDFGIGYSLNKNWSVGGTFRYSEKKNKSGLWQSCDGYLLDLVHKTKGYGVQLKSRMRLSIFDPSYSIDCSNGFRPRFDICPEKGLTSWKLKPYLADEIMYDLEERNLYRNRVIVGLKASPLKQLSLDLFVMNEKTEKNDQWAENWNSGLAATLSF